MKNILVFGMTENPGGVESFIISYYRKMNHKKIHFDFLANTKNQIAYENELSKMGSKVFHIHSRSRHPIKYYKELNSFFRKYAQNYQCIWLNLNSLANIDYLKLAKKYNIPRRIIHSHNSQNMDGRFRGYLHKINKKQIQYYATDYWACSVKAANWFYDDNLMSKVKIIKNAIDLTRVKFDLNKRRKIRQAYNITNSFVIGNIGRLHFQKNQVFILKIFKELLVKIPNAKLIFVGQGPDRDKLEKLAIEFNINDKVIFAGVQTDISKWLSSFDLFIFPSLFEGFPIAGLEAQANGVPILASDNIIPDDAIINDNLYFLNLKNSPDVWANEILKLKKTLYRIGDIDVIKNFNNSGYNIDYAARKLETKLLEKYYE